MQIQRLDTGHMGTNTYVLYGEEPGVCIVIDPADDGPVLDFMAKEGLRCAYILLTHAHFDHIMGVARLQAQTSAKIGIQEEDAAGLYDTRVNLADMARCVVEPSKADVAFKDGDTLSAAGFSIRVLHTPGHTKGGACYVIDTPEKVIFSGDTLFHRSVGRYDLPNCSEKALLDGICDKLYTLPGDYAVYPGHGPATWLEEERVHNPYARPRS